MFIHHRSLDPTIKRRKRSRLQSVAENSKPLGGGLGLFCAEESPKKHDMVRRMTTRPKTPSIGIPNKYCCWLQWPQSAREAIKSYLKSLKQSFHISTGLLTKSSNMPKAETNLLAEMRFSSVTLQHAFAVLRLITQASCSPCPAIRPEPRTENARFSTTDRHFAYCIFMAFLHPLAKDFTQAF